MKLIANTQKPDELQARLATLIGRQVQLKLHMNQSTMVSVRPKEAHVLVNLHKEFVQASEPVIHSLADYIKGERGAKTVPLKRFVHEVVCGIDLSSQGKKVGSAQGVYWDLQALYNDLESKYFDTPLNLHVAWFGTRKRRKMPKKSTLGLYYDMRRMVKIHVLLDNPKVPQYVVEYVLYHEMAHAICPAEVTRFGKVVVHTKKFHSIEEQYPLAKEAEIWLHGNMHILYPSQLKRWF